jgi:NDP-sugar pyrophosphorylase family protein/quercetin dioxygenase-like cupin family protein
MYKVVHKPWGKEEWLALNQFYCYKRIYINAGYKTSYQYHEFKHETNYIISGTAEVWLENDEGIVEKKIMVAGDFFDVVPPKKHRVIAISDIILQEVSTPHVDDVFRINDEFNRSDGKIDAEHKTPAVLILAAGIGSRLGDLTASVNKAMLPINNKAILSHIIEKFPKEYDFIIALGYKGKELKQYCQLAHPDLKFTFVEIDNITGEGSGPGYSALQCKRYLERPFYFITSDCIINSKIPHLDGNWLGVYPTGYPEKYSTVKSDDDYNILDFTNKNKDGHNEAFIGIASIWDYSIFWRELDSNITGGEIVSAFKNVEKYNSFKIKKLEWLDTGNLDDLDKAKNYFNDSPLSLNKITDEIAYRVGKFIKFNPDASIIENKSKRAFLLNKLIPEGFKSTSNFITYDWESGSTLYESDSLELYLKFLEEFSANIKKSRLFNIGREVFDKFYVEKTGERKKKFLDRFGERYAQQSFNINNRQYGSLDSILENINIESFYDSNLYSLFHGDLQFDNIIYNNESDRFSYIDWRESFGGITEGGDIYYDLAKLYGGLIIPYNMMKKNDSIQFSEGSSIVEYSYQISQNLSKFKRHYENWLSENGFNLDKVKFITGIIFLNMSPLHDDTFSKMLWFKSIEMLSVYDRQGY